MELTIPNDIANFAAKVIEAENKKYEEYEISIKNFPASAGKSYNLNIRKNRGIVRYERNLVLAIYDKSITAYIVDSDDVGSLDNFCNDIYQVRGLLFCAALVYIYEKNSIYESEISYDLSCRIYKDESILQIKKICNIDELQERLEYHSAKCGEEGIILKNIADGEYILRYK